MAPILAAPAVEPAASLAAEPPVATSRPGSDASVRAAAPLATAPLAAAPLVAAPAQLQADPSQRRGRDARIDAPGRDLSIQRRGQLDDAGARSRFVGHASGQATDVPVGEAEATVSDGLAVFL
ncbi:MAG TPA: hypothetical protein VGL23_01710 [Chloroflexota bacterium]